MRISVEDETGRGSALLPMITAETKGASLTQEQIPYDVDGRLGIWSGNA